MNIEPQAFKGVRLLPLVVLTMCFVFMCGCVTRGPKVLSKGSDAEIEAEALRIAKADIAAGKPRVCYAGGIGVSPAGVPGESFELVRNLPRLPLPCGCTDPLTLPAQRFAQVYNTEVLRHLREQRRN